MKRSLQIIALALALALLAAGCAAKGQDSGDSGYGVSYSNGTNRDQSSAADGILDYVTTPEEAPAAPAPDADKAETAEGDVLASRKIIRDASLDIQTLAFDDFLTALEAAIAQVGGYVSSSYTSGNGYYGSSLRWAEVEARVPAERLDDFLASVGDLGNVVDRRISLRDVTAPYADTEAHLTALRTERDALLEILAAAETVEDLISVQSRLSDVQYEIESYEATLRTYDDQIALSTVTMNIREVERETPVAEETFWQEVGRRFSESLADVGDGFRSFGAWFLGNLPAIVVWAVILGGATVVIVLLVRRGGKRNGTRAVCRAQRRAARQAPAVPAATEAESGKEDESPKA